MTCPERRRRARRNADLPARHGAIRAQRGGYRPWWPNGGGDGATGSSWATLHASPPVKLDVLASNCPLLDSVSIFLRRYVAYRRRERRELAADGIPVLIVPESAMRPTECEDAVGSAER